MCGLAGILRRGGDPVPPALVEAMIASLRHRGPDGEGSFFAPGLGLGHTRLRIIDLTVGSDQPFRDSESGLVLVYNGEIYNYVELRRELEALGHRFRTTGDTEVLLRSYLEWGAGCLGRLNGMFAFAVWSERERSLFLARDRFGEKPLYLARSRHGLIFASEVKAILAVRPELKAPSGRALYRYVARGDLDLDDESFFAGIRSLPAAHYLRVGPGGGGEPVRYWTPRATRVPADAGEAVEAFRSLLFDAVRIRQRADVPVGSSLSGGIDSSSIVGIIEAQKAISGVRHQRTFSARFQSSAHDEGHWIEQVRRFAEVTSFDAWVEPQGFPEEFDHLQRHQEEPMASTSPYAQWLVMRLARERDTTVLLDGQGADELLAGYEQAHGMLWAHWLASLRPDRALAEMSAYVVRYRGFLRPALFAAYYLLPDGLRDRLAVRYYGTSRVSSPAIRERYAPAHVSSPNPFPDRLRNELYRWQTVTQLPELLRYADRNSMAHSREIRLPFLDHRLVEFAFGLPADLLLHRATTKVALRAAMRGIVPDPIIDRRYKLTYAPPQEAWLRGPLQPWLDAQLAAAEGRAEIYNTAEVKRLRQRARAGRDLTVAWRVASTEGWFTTMIEGTPVPPAPFEDRSRLSW